MEYPANKQVLETRCRMLDGVRRHFIGAGFLEVETPVRVPIPALELHIDAEPCGTHFLRTSAELYMKRLLADGHRAIFELGPVFRQGERGTFHAPEFTMLEWYRADADYMDVLADTRALLLQLARTVSGGDTLQRGGETVDLAAPWVVMSVSDAFTRYAGWNPVEAYDADRFDLDLVTLVEPALPKHSPVVLKDYPAEAAALSRLRPGFPPVAERWELYLFGMELANAYSELVDPAEQRARFEECAVSRRALGKTVYPVDERFLQAMEEGMPPCAGVALGIDRLVMAFTGAAGIKDVRAFCP